MKRTYEEFTAVVALARARADFADAVTRKVLMRDARTIMAAVMSEHRVAAALERSSANVARARARNQEAASERSGGA